MLLRKSPFQFKNALNERRTNEISSMHLDQALLFSKFDLSTWEQLLGNVRVFLEKCRMRGQKDSISEYQKFVMMKNVYLEKPRATLDRLVTLPILKSFVKKGPVVNGMHCLSLSDAKMEIFKRFNRLDFQTSFIHAFGQRNFSLANVSYDPEKMSLQITGPGEGAIPDLRWALAKWQASAQGQIDFLTNGFFDFVELSPGKFVMKTWATSHQVEVATKISAFVKSFQISPSDLLFLEALIFLHDGHLPTPTQTPSVLKGLSLLTEAVA